MSKPTQEELAAVMDYRPYQGDFVSTSAKSRLHSLGAVRPPILRDGRPMHKIGGTRYRASHLAWLAMTGSWPAPGMGIYFKDGDRTNLLWDNMHLKPCNSGDYT